MKGILITGASGGIGSELVKLFQETDWNVISTDKKKPKGLKNDDSFIELNLEDLIKDNNLRNQFYREVIDKNDGEPISALINNAALQIVKPFKLLEVDDWEKSINVNFLAPVLLSKIFLKNLIKNKGNIINISSIHTNLTKKNFSAYSTTKSALSSLTRALSLELAPLVKVNGIEPAAINTPMLADGFDENFNIEELSSLHPSNKIGEPKDIFKTVLFLLDPCNSFIHGCNIELGGGIHNRLFDLD